MKTSDTSELVRALEDQCSAIEQAKYRIERDEMNLFSRAVKLWIECYGDYSIIDFRCGGVELLYTTMSGNRLWAKTHAIDVRKSIDSKGNETYWINGIYIEISEIKESGSIYIDRGYEISYTLLIQALMREVKSKIERN